MKGVYSVLVICFIFSSSASFGQMKLLYLNAERPTTSANSVKQINRTPFNSQSSILAQFIPQNLYTQHFGFFCRQELKMQQAHIPVTFRLGSMENCNRLEQKPGYR